ncbi:MurR/RpiR family transcriptional regulator [Bacillus sp. V2I10]|uniref:MurR/RpiR family transcriptional regulator n=1 Tax=Bacillus sp. V2I10 TaxID=3042276 RepID=UPI00277E1921|nr:MurR/RpiR family transcriptional regulator [Bacillus sp. V2I10]MDQ0857167.1 DNA-binding MurR/RpiR family transcriptional regulator [Bacillus sp. V2I10]
MYNFIAKLLNFIESSTDHTNSEIVIAEYILRHVDRIPGMSIYQLAEACHTSPATITRFCKKFENISFKELKEYARTYIEFNDSEVDYTEVEETLNEDMLLTYFSDVQKSLQETSELINSKEILEIVKRIHQAKKVSFFGVTFSHVIARNAQFKFMRLGKYSTAYSNHENQIADAESLTGADVAVVISFSGETRFIVRLVKTLREKGIPIVAITGNEESFLAKHAADMIRVSNRKVTTYKSPIIEELSMMSVVNSVYMIYSLFLGGLERK